MVRTQILLATYNGERFLEEQLASILNQTYTDWEILARDDGSTDRTTEILSAFKEKHPDKINIIEDNDKNLGACYNFTKLMEASTADIICFSDQDDIWHPDKMKVSIKHLEEMQKEHGTDTPALIHHDISIINQQGIEIAPSFDKENNIDKNNNSLNHILVQPTVHGFAATVNKALIDKALPLPQVLDMHDNYITLVAQTFGHINYIPEQLANYRIHENNVAGGQNEFYNLSSKDFSLSNLFNGHSVKCIKTLLNSAHEALIEKCNVAASFLEQYGDEMSEEKSKLFEDFSKLADVSSIERKALILKNGFLPTSPKLAAAFIALG